MNAKMKEDYDKKWRKELRDEATEGIIYYLGNKAQRHVDILILHYDMDIHVDISTLSIVPDMQNRHGREKVW